MSADLIHSLDLPEGWALSTVTQLVEQGVLDKPLDGNHGGIHPKTSDYVESGVPFIMASDLDNGRINFNKCKFIAKNQAKSLRKGFAKTGDVLLSHKATIGRTAIVQESIHDFLVLTPQVTYYRIADSNRLSNRYLKSYFDSHFFQTILAQWAGAGSTRAYLGITDQLKLPILLPPSDVQESIANIVGSIDDKVELSRQINQTLEEIAQAIFKSWFVDFEPVKAKIEAKANGQDTERAAMCAISGKSDAELDQLSPNQFSQLCATAGIFPEDLSNSELGLIPIGWKAGNIGDVAIAKGGYAYKSIIFKEVGHPVVKIKNIVGDGTVDLTECQCIDDGQAQITSGFKLSNGDLLMAMTGATVGKVGLVVLSEETAYLNQRVAKFESKEFKSRISWFLFCAFRRGSIFEQVVGTAQGSAQPNISSKGIESARIVVPTSNCLHEFIDKVEPLFSKWMSNQNEINKLAAIRDALLPRLLSGEIELESNHTSS